MLKKSTLGAIGITLLSSPSTHAFITSINSGHSNHNAPYLLQIGNETPEQEAENFITRVTQDGIKFLKNEELTEAQRKKEFQKFLEENFDLKTIGRFALGRYWRSSSPEQKTSYLNLFEEMIVDVYSRRFSEYDSQSISVTNARAQGESDIQVTSKVIQKSGPDISLEWRVRKKKSGEFKIVDVIVEGVSMSLTQRSDFASVIQRGGGNVDVLIAHLDGKQ